MRNRLFQVIDGNPVITAPLLNLKAFKDLFKTDNTDDKSVYKKWMLYLYYMYDYKSEFYEVKDKQKKVLKEVFGRTDIVVPKKLEPCIKEYVDKNTPAEQRTLDAVIASSDRVVDNLSKIQQDVNQLDKVIENIEKEINRSLVEGDTMIVIELTKEKLEIQKRQLDLIKMSSDIIPRVEKNVESIVNLRNKVEIAMDKLSDRNDKLEDHIIDEFLQKVEAGHYTTDQ